MAILGRACIRSRFSYILRRSVTAEQQTLLNELVWMDPERLSGTPCFKGRRVPMQALIDHIEGNATLDQFLEGFPSVSREQAVQFMELARDSLLARPSPKLDWRSSTFQGDGLD